MPDELLLLLEKVEKEQKPAISSAVMPATFAAQACISVYDV
jgi:hypothetical protein